MRMRFSLRLACVALMAGAGTGCYSYVQMDGPIQTGDAVRAHLDLEAQVRRSEMLGEPTRRLEGTVLAVDPDGGFQLEVTLGRNVADYGPAGGRFTRIFEFDPGEVQTLERRKLSVLKTAVLAGLGVAITSVAVDRAITGGTDGESGGPGTGISLIFGTIPILSGR